jgi:Uncharacterized protein conserved in bacteria
MPSQSRSDPISLLQEQDKGRLKHFLPIKYGRMLKSPFTFMRGAAILMTTDLATTSVTGQQVQLCGDADLLNFGIFATPERKLVFDITISMKHILVRGSGISNVWPPVR